MPPVPNATTQFLLGLPKPRERVLLSATPGTRKVIYARHTEMDYGQNIRELNPTIAEHADLIGTELPAGEGKSCEMAIKF